MIWRIRPSRNVSYVYERACWIRMEAADEEEKPIQKVRSETP